MLTLLSSFKVNFVNSLNHKYGRPSLLELLPSKGTFSLSVDEVFADLGLSESVNSLSEFMLVEDSTHLNNQAFPARWNTNQMTRQVLFRACRALNPDYVVETGVANGTSSRILLSAIDMNKNGLLQSFDIDPEASKSICDPALLKLWRFCHLKGSKSKSLSTLSTIVSEHIHDSILWYHDSDHSSWWQFNEFKVFAALNARTKVFFCDDIDSSYGWLDSLKWLESFGRPFSSSCLFDGYKVTGAIVIR
jgi:hypothetical protein